MFFTEIKDDGKHDGGYLEQGKSKGQKEHKEQKEHKDKGKGKGKKELILQLHEKAGTKRLEALLIARMIILDWISGESDPTCSSTVGLHRFSCDVQRSSQHQGFSASFAPPFHGGLMQ
ncbi:MAG: hypothetical protein MZV70_65755 [Desulfobacterales bacterium]|nr:hypothetical protein [Desulfobacterales bacterium]